jgi:DNA-binding response OmpR family regulator
MSYLLVVDDDELTRSLLCKRLSNLGFNILSASSGKQCLEELDRSSISLVLLDMMMPGKSGLETLSEIRQTYSSADLPVIMTTADGDEANATINALQAGANDFLSKPVNLEIARARIHTQLKMAALYKQIIDKNKLETINAMITTYNHEINNPLAIAIGLLQRSKLVEEQERFDKVMNALNRIKDIIVKIKNLQTHQVEFEAYTTNSKMVKLS